MATSEPGTRRPSRLPLGIFFLALVGAASFLYYYFDVFMPRVQDATAARGLGNGYSLGGDFYPIWLTSREWIHNHRDPYGPEMASEIQTGLFGRPLDASIPSDYKDLRRFAHPAFTDLLFWPLAELPFPISRIVVVCLLAAMTFASVLLWLRALAWHPAWSGYGVILLLALCSYPALEGLYAGQLGLMVAFLLAAAILALQRDRFLLAGILMALTTIKPQVTALVILYLLLWSLHDWRARGRFCLGMFSTLVLLVGTSLAVSPHWIQSWIHTVLAYRHYTRPPLVFEVLTSPLGPRLADPAAIVLTAASIIFCIWAAWLNRAAASSSLAFWFTLTLSLTITTITILPGQAVYDHLILIPGILVLARHRRNLCDSGPLPRALFWISSFVLLWPWIAAFGMIVVHPWLSPSLSLPLRSAASLPFAVLALLAWTWRVNAVTSQESV